MRKISPNLLIFIIYFNPFTLYWYKFMYGITMEGFFVLFFSFLCSIVFIRLIYIKSSELKLVKKITLILGISLFIAITSLLLSQAIFGNVKSIIEIEFKHIPGLFALGLITPVFWTSMITYISLSMLNK